MKKYFLFAGLFALTLSLSSCDFFAKFLGESSTHQNSSFSLGSGTANSYEKAFTTITYEDVNRNGGPGLAQATLTSIGSPSILVLPILQSDYSLSISEQERILTRLEACFFGESEETSWESVASFYEKSSYGALHLNGEIMPWFDCGYSSHQIENLNSSAATAEGAIQVMKDAIQYWENEGLLDTSRFDTDADGYIDSVWVIYSGPNCQNDWNAPENNWAYTYWNMEEENHASPVPMSFAWASWDFMNEGYGEGGIDAHTYIHETGHLLGLPDYYDSSYYSSVSPAGGVDMMDFNIIDHNAWSKYALGWISPQIANKESKSIEIGSLAETGEALLIPTPDGFNGSAFDEFLMVEYYTPTLLNQADSETPYGQTQGLQEEGIRIWHVDSRLLQLRADPAGVWGTTYQYSFAYTDELYEMGDEYQQVGDSVVVNQMVAFSNAQGYNWESTSYPEYGISANPDVAHIRQLTFISKNPKKNFGDSYLVQTNDDLFQVGDVFDPNEAYRQFPFGGQGVTNDGSYFFDLPTITVNSLGDKASLTITY